MPVASQSSVCFAGEVRHERGFIDALVQRIQAFILALMVFLQTLYSPDAAKQYQERSRRRAKSGGSGSGSRLGGGPRINGMSNLGGSSGSGTYRVIAGACASQAPI